MVPQRGKLKMIDTYALKNRLFKETALPLLTEKQRQEWHNKKWEKISKKASYQTALADIEAEVERQLDLALDLHDRLCDRVKEELPDGFTFASSFHGSSWAGFYVWPGGYEPGKRNGVNVLINPETNLYKAYGTDGYELIDSLGDRLTAGDAAKVALAWLSGK